MGEDGRGKEERKRGVGERERGEDYYPHWRYDNLAAHVL